MKHGDRLEILQRRRRAFRVRTASGAEGWTDDSQLLSSGDMAQLRDLAARAAKLPSQGVATVDVDVNVRTQPSAEAPSFFQIKEKQKVDVLGRVMMPRAPLTRQPLIPKAAKKAKTAPAKSAKPSKYPPPPMPKPPGPPQNWLELSKTEPPDTDDSEEPAEPPKPVITDSWTLVRTANGQTGWARSRSLTMAIPDEVAQYAEGRRIVAYFPLGEVRDGDVKKNIWLWATVGGRPAWDFESFRVFIWSLRRHRYETAYIERNLEGYLPILLETVDYTGAKYPGFSVCLAKGDGPRHRRSYALLGNMVRSAGERPCEAAPALLPPPPGTAAAAPAQGEQTEAKESFTSRIRKKLQGLFRKK